jgi:hypothetical protein
MLHCPLRFGTDVRAQFASVRQGPHEEAISEEGTQAGTRNENPRQEEVSMPRR